MTFVFSTYIRMYVDLLVVEFSRNIRILESLVVVQINNRHTYIPRSLSVTPNLVPPPKMALPGTKTATKLLPPEINLVAVIAPP